MPSAKRAYTKSKKGCFTCKRRKIKCDETRPVCSRCTKTGIQCLYSDSMKTAVHNNNPTTKRTNTRQPDTITSASSSSSSGTQKIHNNNSRNDDNNSVNSTNNNTSTTNYSSATNHSSTNNPVSSNSHNPVNVYYLPPLAPIIPTHTPSTVTTLLPPTTRSLYTSGPVVAPAVIPPRQFIQLPPIRTNTNDISEHYKFVFDDMFNNIAKLVKFSLLPELDSIVKPLTHYYFFELNDDIRHSVHSLVFLMQFHNTYHQHLPKDANSHINLDAYLSLSRYHFEKIYNLDFHNGPQVNYLILLLKVVHYIANPGFKVTSADFLNTFLSMEELKDFSNVVLECTPSQLEIQAGDNNSNTVKTNLNSGDKKSSIDLDQNLERLIQQEKDNRSLTNFERTSLQKFASKIKTAKNLNSSSLIRLVLHLFQNIDKEFIQLVDQNEPKALILMAYAIYVIFTKVRTNLYLSSAIFEDEINYILFKLDSADQAHWKVWLTPIIST